MADKVKTWKEIMIEDFEEDLVKLNAKKSLIVDTPEDYIKGKIDKIDLCLPNLPDRKPTKTGNITMKQYMNILRKELVDEPQKVIDRELIKLNSKITKVNSQKEDVELGNC